LKSAEALALFAKYHVLSERELQSRFDIYIEQYCKSIKVEAKLMTKMARTMIYPAAVRFQNQLASTGANLRLLDCEFDSETLERVGALAKGLQDSAAGLEEALAEHGFSDLLAEAQHFCDAVQPAMAQVRKYADELEGLVADDLWPLPTYQEMLFIK
jgi:glutamine synthetase